jgi:hypothetical protein
MMPGGTGGVDSVVSVTCKSWLLFFIRFGGRMLLFPVLTEYRALFAMKLFESTTLGILNDFSF